MRVRDITITEQRINVTVYFRHKGLHERICNVLLLAMAIIVFVLLQPCLSFADERTDLIEPDIHFVLSPQEVQFIRSLEPLRVMIDDNFVPLSSYDTRTDTFRGISVDLFRHIADRLGLKYQMLHDAKLSWADKVELFNNKQIDLLMPVSFTKERDRVGVFTTSIYDTYYTAIATKSQRIRIKNTRDLAGYKIGVTKASAIIPFIQSFVPASHIISYNNQSDLYQGVRNGHVDIALQNKSVFQEDRFNLGFVDLTMLHTIMESPRRYAYYLNRTEQYQKLAAIIDRYLAGIDYSRLIARYERSEEELILLYTEQKNQKKLLVYGVAGSLTLLVMFALAYFNRRRFTSMLAVSLEQVKHQKKLLQKSEESYRNLFNNSRDALTILEPPGWNFSSGNLAAVHMFCASDENALISYRPWELSPERQPDGSESILKAKEMIDTALRKGYHFFEWTHRRVNGEEFQSDVLLTRIDQEGQLILQATIRDNTDRKKAEAELRIAATAFQSQEGMIVTDSNGLILRVNRAFTKICGFTEEEVVGHNPRILKSGRHNADFFRKMWDSINQTGGWQGEIWDRHKNGGEYPKWLTISAVKDNDGNVTNYIGVHYDITERKLAEEKINKLAFFDHLTGLPNRTLLLDRLKQTMTSSSRNGNYGALLFIDLDDFKTLNDTLGHDMGDLLLKEVAQRLITCIRAEDTTARLGGDEFVVMLASLSADGKAAARQTEIVGGKILTMLNQPYQLRDVTYNSTPSIGAALFNGNQTEVDVLLKQADIAMYRSKEAGRNTLRFFDPDMETVVMERAALEKDLRNAVQKRQFLLHYQAQMASGKLTGSEVLVRWQHPQRGMVSPAEFIPLAEETGLILFLGQWVLETACTQLAMWATIPDMAHLTLAVNVSARQFRQADFVEQVLEILHITGANPQRLKLELTESMLVSNVEEIIKKMFALKARGVGFSLDDFGTGYSSLSYLKRLPLDQLKIDQSFVRDVLIDPNDAAIARTVIALAQGLGLSVIAEGVETAEQRDFLAHSGCHAYQGYFFSRPLPIEGFEDFARKVDAAGTV
ncbi:MAG: EAL domain-containing protein [Desulfuromonadales bacterium]